MTKDLGDGIQLLLGVKKEGGEEKTSTQSYHFDKNEWTPKAVKKWLKEHNETPIELEMAEKSEVKEDASGSNTVSNSIMGTSDITGNKEIKSNGNIVTHQGDIIPEQVPIDRVPEKLFSSSVRQQDLPELLESTIRPDDEILIEKLEPEGISEDYDGSDLNESVINEPDVEVEPQPIRPNFSLDKARQKLVDWSKNDDGSVNKRPLLKWFLDVDGGSAQSVENYRYPTGYVIDGNPQYCKLSLDASWDLAAGKQTGVANRNIQKKIIFIKNREGIPLTEEQMDFTERHMSADKVNYHTLEDDNSPGGIEFVDQTELKLNSSPAGSKIIYEDDQVIDVPVVPMREGVFTGTDGIPTLKKFEYFGKDAHWLEGQPILKGHTAPTELVTYKHNRIGKLMNVIARPDKKDVVAVARYYKEKLTPEDLTRIKSGIPYDGSIAYTTHTSMTPGELNGTKYNAVEDGGYHFYHFAELANGIGACSTKDGCGFMLNETSNNDMKLNYRCKKQGNSYKCPGSVDDTSPVVKKVDTFEKDGRKGGVFQSPNGKFFGVAIDSNGEKHAWNANSQRQARALVSTFVNDGKTYGMHDEADASDPISENSAYDITNDPYVLLLNDDDKHNVFYNDKRRAEINQTNDIWTIKLNSSLGGYGSLEANTEQDAIEWSKTYVKSGLIPINMKYNYKNSNFKSLVGNDNMTKLNEKKGMVKDADGNECMFFDMKDKKCPAKEEGEEEEMDISEEEAKPTEKKNSRFTKHGNNMKTEYIEADVDVQKMNEAFEQKLNERDAKITELTKQVDDLIQKQNAAEQALIDAKAQADFEAFTLKLNAKAREDAKTHYEGFKSDGWTYFDANPGLLRAETPKMNARGQPAAEGDNGSNLQAARDMLKKNQKELFGKRSH